MLYYLLACTIFLSMLWVWAIAYLEGEGPRYGYPCDMWPPTLLYLLLTCPCLETDIFGAFL